MQKIEQGQLWRTRGGMVMRILATDLPGGSGQPVAAVEMANGALHRFFLDGKFLVSRRESDYDLIELFVPPLEAEGWAVVSKASETASGKLAYSKAFLLLYETKEEAEWAAITHQGERAVRVRVTEVRDGE